MAAEGFNSKVVESAAGQAAEERLRKVLLAGLGLGVALAMLALVALALGGAVRPFLAALALLGGAGAVLLGLRGLGILRADIAQASAEWRAALQEKEALLEAANREIAELRAQHEREQAEIAALAAGLDELHKQRTANREERERLLSELAQRFEQSVGDVVGGVAAATSQLQQTASSMAQTADLASSQMHALSSGLCDASAGVTAAAAASDEFAMSIGEISRQASNSAQLARRATETAARADATISQLTTSASQVSQIVEMISSIARRTNLLALNASIEAARGGEAGRGFAVVAAEVKELASQTGRFTEEVASQIRAMEDSTGASVKALHAIMDQIRELEETSISIAAAVDQQSVAGQDLARSIDMAARSTEAVTGNVEQVRDISHSTGEAAAQVLGSSSELERQALQLREQVHGFLDRIRAAA